MNLAAKTEIICQSGLTAMPQYSAGTPISAGEVIRWNSSQGLYSNLEFDLEIVAAAAVNLTDAELFGIAVEENSFNDKTITAATNAADTLTITSHGLLTGQGPVRIASDAADLPLGLDADTDYWVIYVDANTIQLATSLVNAFAETAVDFTDDGTGNLSLSDSPEQSYRARLLSYGLLGPANDGAVTLSAYIGWTSRIKHRPRTVAYFCTATLSSAVATSVRVCPVVRD